MFGAVALFIVLLVAMLYLAFVRFRNPPQPRAVPTPVGAHVVGAARGFAWAHAGVSSEIRPANRSAAGSRHA